MKQNVSQLIREFSYEPHEIQIKYTSREPMDRIHSSKDVYDFIRKRVYDDQLDLREASWIIVLNRANQVIGMNVLTIGNLHGVVIDIQLVFTIALQARASAFIIAHNHPSGSIKPSKSDIDLTEKMTRIADDLDCNFLDHLILCKNSYYSFADNALLK